MSRVSARSSRTVLVALEAPALAVLLTGIVPLQAQAQGALAQQVLARCASLADDAERLACYDAAARWIEAVEPDAKPDTQTEAAAAGTAPEPSAIAPAPSTANAADTFGRAQLGDAGIDKITSRIVGTFMGWHGNTRFTLENGQVWQQDEPGRGIYRLESPQVTIRHGAMGTFLMQIEGVRRSLRVRRVE